jgi:hypothetical protein
MNNFTEIKYDVVKGNGVFNIGVGKLNYEKMACQVVASEYTGTTATVTIQESNNGTDWNDITDNTDSLVITITTNGSYMLKTSIFYARYIRANFLVGDATDGILTVTTYFKDKNI